jgi:hypothetical protein
MAKLLTELCNDEYPSLLFISVRNIHTLSLFVLMRKHGFYEIPNLKSSKDAICSLKKND